jgi:hypothetical protein
MELVSWLLVGWLVVWMVVGLIGWLVVSFDGWVAG